MHGAAAEVEEEHEGPCHGAGQASTGHDQVVGDVLGNIVATGPWWRLP